MVLLLVPESRFERLLKVEATSELQSQLASTDFGPQDKPIFADEVEVVVPRLASVGPTHAPHKKSQLQLLSLWSGVSPHSNLLDIFLRPFPLIAYPAVLWGTLACKPMMQPLLSPASLTEYF